MASGRRSTAAFLPWVGALLACACAATGSHDAPADWPAVRDELARRVQRDQELRTQATVGDAVDHALVEQITAVDRENTAWMKDLVARHGWPAEAHVGEEGAGNAWLLVQHADLDVEFQEHCLELLRDAVAAGEASPKHLVYLEDRVDMHRGRPQRYGTQFISRDGRLQPYTLEDPARVDEWRAEVGLGTLEEYAKLFEQE